MTSSHPLLLCAAEVAGSGAMSRTMLREVRKVRQIVGEPKRRWFTDHEMDLTVWMEAGEIVGFQLTYDKPHAEKAVTWRPSPAALLHARVDDGESRPGKFKGTPILVADGVLDAWYVCGKFLRLSSEVPPRLREFIARKLTAGGGNV